MNPRKYLIVSVLHEFCLWVIFIYQPTTLSLPSMAQEMFIMVAEPLEIAKHIKTGQYEIPTAQLLTDKTESFN